MGRPRPVRPHARRLLLWLAALAVVLGGAWRPTPAWAADDSIDAWAVAYTVQSDGTTHVVETIAYRFGSASARHGIQRDLVTREAWDKGSDAVYDVSDVTVTSPDANADVHVQHTGEGRDRGVVLRIGSATATVGQAVAHYTIGYTVSGATRVADGTGQFSWDVMGNETPTARNITVTVRVPKGATGATCFVGAAGRSSTTPCSSAKVSGGVATFTQARRPAGQTLTVAARMATGAVTAPGPVLEPRGDAAQVRQRNIGLAATVASLVLSPLLGLLWWRRHGRDLRYVGLAPGVVPSAGEPVTERPSGHVEVPVAFVPPQVSPAEAQVLLDGEVSTRLTTATLVDLAVRGAVQLSTTADDPSVRLVDPSRATRPHEQVLLQRLFAAGGEEVGLGLRGSLYRAHQALVVSVRNQVAASRWFTRIPSARSQGTAFSVLLVVLAGWFFLGGPGTAPWLLLPLVPAVVVTLVVSRRLRHGRRTGLGRALADQAEGFRTYLATAEADQLRFEEGSDVFSWYLPWAIAFGLADRWADLCAELVRQGRLGAAPPSWYYGPWDGWNFYVFNSSLSTMGQAATPLPAPSVSTSSSGFGGGSAFGGGGFAGGGGGGGGVSSW